MEQMQDYTLPAPKCYIFEGFVPSRDESPGTDRSYYVPARLKKNAGMLRSLQFRPRPDGRQTIALIRSAQSGEEPGALNGIVVAMHKAIGDIVINGVEFISRDIKDFEAIGWQALPAVDRIYVMCGKESATHDADLKYPLLQSYLDQKMDANLTVGDEFAMEWLETTRGFPELWINDRDLARRPWVHVRSHEKIDKFLHDHPVAPTNTFEDRLLEGEYAVLLLQAMQKHGVSDMRSLYAKTASPVGGSKLAAPPAGWADWTGKKMTYNGNENVSDYIFGFGSLINTGSRMKSDPNAADAVPVRISNKLGYSRCWNFQHPIAQLTALGVAKVPEGTGWGINGVVAPVLDAAGMEALDAREIGYQRVAIPTEYTTPLGWPKLPDGSRVWMYVPYGKDDEGDAKAPPELEPGTNLEMASFHHPILQTYVDLCILGCLEYSEEYAIEFIHSTVGWDGPWLNDRQIPRRPWTNQPGYATVDNLLKRIIPEHFAKRMLAEEFGAAIIRQPQSVKKLMKLITHHEIKELNYGEGGHFI